MFLQYLASGCMVRCCDVLPNSRFADNDKLGIRLCQSTDCWSGCTRYLMACSCCQMGTFCIELFCVWCLFGWSPICSCVWKGQTSGATRTQIGPTVSRVPELDVLEFSDLASHATYNTHPGYCVVIYSKNGLQLTCSLSSGNVLPVC